MQRTPSAPRRAAALLAVLLALAAAGCGGDGKEEPETTAQPERVDLMLDWIPNPDHVGLYWAREQGLFERARLDVRMRAPSDPSAPIKLVGVGRADLAISYEPELFFAAEKGLPVVSVASVVPVPLNSVIATRRSGIRSAADLRGRSIGVTGIPSDEAILATIRRFGGLRPSDVRAVNVGYNLVTSLLSGKVDAIVGGYRNVEAVQIAHETGTSPIVIPVSEAGVPSYDELVLVANARRLERDPGYADMVRRLVRALVEGTAGARASPAAATRLMARVTDYEPRFLADSVPLTLRLMKAPDGRPLGCMSETAWQSYGEWMLRTGLLKEEVGAASVMTNDYLPYRCR